MMVIGIDPHKRSVTVGAVDAATGRAVKVQTVPARRVGFERLLVWARELAAERVWAVEDVRHVSAGVERVLVDRGERVVRVPPKLMAGARAGGRRRGKSDEIDALAVARAALREGLRSLPAAALEGEALEVRLLGDHREDLVAQRTQAQNRLRWQLHDLDPSFDVPLRGLVRSKGWQRKVQQRLEQPDAQNVRGRIARELLDDIQVLTPRIDALERELAERVAQHAPQLLAEPGVGPLTAAKLIGEVAGIERFATDAQLARAAGIAPIPASSGNNTRHRLDRRGNRQLNAAVHRVAVTRARCHPETRAYLDRKISEGKTRREAIRCLKRHLIRRIWHLLQPPSPAPPPVTIHCQVPLRTSP